MKTILVSLSLILTLSGTAFAQTYPNATTLSAAITSTQTQIVLASGTGVQAGGALYIDMEYIPIVSCAVTACTTVNVQRMTRPAAHGSASIVLVIAKAARPVIMLTHDGARRGGSCSTSTSSVAATALANFSYLPIIDIDTGDIYMCRHNGASGSWVWNKTNYQTINGTAGSVPIAWP
jgi:hypothetical protein